MSGRNEKIQSVGRLKEHEFYHFTTSLQTRFTDLDKERHLNNVAILSLYVEARSQFHISLFGGNTWLSQTIVLRTVSIETDFLHAVYYPKHLSCGINLIEVSENGYMLAIAMFQGPLCIGLQECFIGAWADGKWTTLPSNIREILSNPRVIIKEPT